jgi:aerobic C4-dicarboxylate transport protein
VLSGQDRFDESTMAAHSHGTAEDRPAAEPAPGARVEDSVAEKLEAAAGAGAR